MEFPGRGSRVATSKHDAHDFEIDIPDLDTWRHRVAESNAAIIQDEAILAGLLSSMAPSI